MSSRKPRFSIVSSVEECIDVNVSNDQQCQNSQQNRDSPPNDKSFQTTQSKVMENFIIVWLNLNTDHSNDDKDGLIIQIRSIISTIKIFTDRNECVDFLTDVSDEKVFMIIDDCSNEYFLSILNEIPQLHSIYIFNHHQQELPEQYTKEYKLMKGMYSHIEHIYNAIKYDVYRLATNLISVSIISPNSSLNLDTLDQSFMYTQLLKETIMDIEYDGGKAREEFAQFCLSRCVADDAQPSAIHYFQRCYKEHSAIWWYTKEWFVYSSLNRALRTQDLDFIPKMGFFVQDLHREIEKRYAEIHDHSKTVVYRGQGLSNIDFEKLQKSKGGLLSFNNFLSTSTDRDVSFLFADSNQQNCDQTAVLFKMTIDPSISSTPFTRLADTSQFETESEILFSMHTVFRIGDMKQLDTRLWEVNLTLTDRNDQHLKCLTDYIRNEIGVQNGWGRMAILMMKMGRYDKLLEISNMLAETLSEGNSEMLEMTQTLMGNNIGIAQQSFGNYSMALSNYEKLLKALQKFRPWEYIWIATIYCNIGTAQYSMADFSAALLSFKRAFEIQRQSVPASPILLARIYSNTAHAHFLMGTPLNALEYFEKALEIYQKSLPLDHPDIALTYSNISALHRSLNNYPLALSYIQKALEIQQKYLPQDHPDMAMCHNNIGAVYASMGNYALALSYCRKALEMQQKSQPFDHPSQVFSHNNIAWVCNLMGDFSTALSNLEAALRICQKYLSSNHPHLAMIHTNIGQVHHSMGNFSSALSSLKKALEIQQKSLPYDHSDLVTTYNNIGEVYRLMSDLPRALSNYEKALEISQKSFPSNHPTVASIYNNIGLIHQSLGNYLVARSFCEKTLQIQQEILPPNHPDLIKTYGNIAHLNQLSSDALPAISNIENAVRIQDQFLKANRSLLNPNSSDDNEINEMTNAYLATFSDLRRMMEIQQKLLPLGGSEMSITDETINDVEELMGILPTMLLNMEKGLELEKKYRSSSTGNSTGVNQMFDNCLSMMSSLKKSIRIPSFDHQQTSGNDDGNDSEIFSADQYFDAVLSYHKMLETSQGYMPSNNVSLTTSYNNSGQILISTKNYTHALSLFEKALENLRKCVPINQQLLAKTYHNIALALDGLQRYREAINYAQQAVDTARSSSGSFHDETQVYQDCLDQLKGKL